MLGWGCGWGWLDNEAGPICQIGSLNLIQRCARKYSQAGQRGVVLDDDAACHAGPSIVTASGFAGLVGRYAEPQTRRLEHGSQSLDRWIAAS